MGNHSETVEIDFDPARIGYDSLLDIFWKDHDPFAKSWSRQYRAVIFFHGERQRKLAEASRKRLGEQAGRRIETGIEPASAFHLAEDYHQKYALQANPAIAGELRAYYPDIARFTASTAAARLNGYLGGHGTLAQLDREIGSLGLSPGAGRIVLDLVGRRDGARGKKDADGVACPVP